LAVAFLIRIWELGSVPAAVHPDELAGVVGVLDELTHRAPLRAFFDYRIMYLPLYGICEYVTTWFLGFTPVAFRFPAAAFGVATVFCTVAFTRRLVRDRVVALLAGAIMAILPWDVTISRVGWEPAAMLPFVLGGLWALLAGLQDRRAWLVVLSGALFGAGAYSYRAAFPYALVLSAAIVLCHWPLARRAWRAILAAACAWLAVMLPLILSVAFDRDFFWRDRRISTFAGGVNAHSLHLFVHNYLAHFAFGPLFRSGDGNPNHGPPFGVLYLWMLPWLLFGAIAVWKRHGARIGIFLVVWLLLYPLGGALTNDGIPHFLRTLAGAPLACILTAVGLVEAWAALLRTKLAAYTHAAALGFALIVVVEFTLFCATYFVAYVPASASAYQFENPELFRIVNSYRSQVARVCFRDINTMNSLTLYAYYLRGSNITTFEGTALPCVKPRSLTVTNNRAKAPTGASLVATVQDYHGHVSRYVFLTR
jgi:4-amino-4-deoxy-L-arabinose transferase-like glycosyltransferase